MRGTVFLVSGEKKRYNRKKTGEKGEHYTNNTIGMGWKQADVKDSLKADVKDDLKDDVRADVKGGARAYSIWHARCSR